MPLFRQPSLIDQIDDAWKKHKGELVSIGGGIATVGIASQIARIIHDKHVHEEQKNRDAASIDLQRSSLQNQIMTTNILDNLVKKLSQPQP